MEIAIGQQILHCGIAALRHCRQRILHGGKTRKQMDKPSETRHCGQRILHGGKTRKQMDKPSETSETKLALQTKHHLRKKNLITTKALDN